MQALSRAPQVCLTGLLLTVVACQSRAPRVSYGPEAVSGAAAPGSSQH
ncbi:MAG TPA: hypothetical protein VMV94_18575 [Phycisphaerae bacterium]|nr:hypothetical protein [Phycisphaerae bacterium]